MLKSYFSIALRHIVGQKLYSAINIVGLAVGVTCFILIGQFVRHELSFDRYHSQADRVYRISRDFYAADGGEFHTAGTPPAIAPLLKNDFPQIDQAARISKCGSGVLVSNGDRAFHENQFAAADPALLSMLDFVWLQGNPATALAGPSSIVLTESIARKYFGDADPIGRTLTIENRTPLQVTGVIRDLPDNTHVRFDMLASMGYVVSVYGEQFLNVWNMNCYYTYALLREGASIDTVQSDARQFFERHVQGPARTNGFTAIPLSDVHMTSRYEFDMRPAGSLGVVLASSAVAVLILLIASINFMNLATARAAQRAKEVGVRKVVGADRIRLIAQFLGESLLLTSIAVLLALAVVEVVLPAFGNFVQKDLSFDYMSNPSTLAFLAGLTLVVGLAAGSYPAFYLSAFEPAKVLKGDLTRGTAAATFRKALVVLQFSISIALLTAAAIVYQQMQYARNIELGYDTEQIVVVTGSQEDGLGAQWEALRREWLVHPEITEATASFQTPGSVIGVFSRVRVEGGEPDLPPIPTMFVDYGFFETYGIELLAGRTFSEDFGADRLPDAADENGGRAPGFILNALGARRYGWTPETAIGKWVEMYNGPSVLHGTVVGVVADAHFESVHFPIQPVLFVLSPARLAGRAALADASIRVSGRDLQNTLTHIDATWAAFVPNQPITRRFLDLDFQALYVSEERQGRVFTYFSALAIFIACLGLFGLASYTTERRTKEIGVRKVMGGTTWDVVKLFTAEFSKLVLLANVVAWPIAYFVMQRWLASFAYRIDIGPLVFIGSALVAFAIACLTVGAVAARAANTKPIRALRYE
jgi:putative ABC transport system permease protein